MNYEQKYKEALGWMQSLYKGLHGITKEDAEHYFPELKEGEDERIRKGLVKAFGTIGKKDWGGLIVRDILAWLEKQKEFVSTDFDDVWETADCDELTAPLEKYSKDAIKKMCHAWYDKGIELERRNWLEGPPKALDPDKVIEWLNNQACLGWIEDVEVDKFVEKFKKDFKL